jgi:hypothetical protein
MNDNFSQKHQKQMPPNALLIFLSPYWNFQSNVTMSTRWQKTAIWQFSHLTNDWVRQSSAFESWPKSAIWIESVDPQGAYDTKKLGIPTLRRSLDNTVSLVTLISFSQPSTRSTRFELQALNSEVEASYFVEFSCSGRGTNKNLETCSREQDTDFTHTRSLRPTRFQQWFWPKGKRKQILTQTLPNRRVCMKYPQTGIKKNFWLPSSYQKIALQRILRASFQVFVRKILIKKTFFQRRIKFENKSSKQTRITHLEKPA